MLKNIMDSSLVTLAIVITNIIFKQTQKAYMYVLYFIITFLGLLAIDKVYGECPLDSKFEIMINKKFLDGIKCLSAQERQYYQEKYDFHHQNGDRCYNAAKDRCWWLPKKDQREWAKHAWQAAVASVIPSTPMSKIAAVVLYALSNYGDSVIDEWHYIEDKLNWAHYHYDMMEFYAAVLAKG